MEQFFLNHCIEKGNMHTIISSADRGKLGQGAGSRRYSVRNVDIYIQKLILLFIGHCLALIEIQKKTTPKIDLESKLFELVSEKKIVQISLVKIKYQSKCYFRLHILVKFLFLTLYLPKQPLLYGLPILQMLVPVVTAPMSHAGCSSPHRQ